MVVRALLAASYADKLSDQLASADIVGYGLVLGAELAYAPAVSRTRLISNAGADPTWSPPRWLVSSSQKSLIHKELNTKNPLLGLQEGK